MELLEVLTLLWTSGWAWYAIKRLLHRDRNSLPIVYLIFFFEYAAPLGFDLVVGIPDYTGQPGFAMSSNDTYVRLLYCVFLFLVPPLWLAKAPIHDRLPFTASSRWTRMVLRATSFLPVLLLFLAPQPEIYLKYAGIMTSGVGADVRAFHILVSIGTMVAVFSIASRCLTEALSLGIVIEVGAATFLCAWMNGKRSILAEALLLILLALWYRGALAGKKLAWAGAIGGMGLGLFSVLYQANVRSDSFDPDSRDRAQQAARIDFTRDSRVKMALFAELYPERMQILNYRAENLVYYATCFVPRSIWKDKPYGYATYFTSAMLNIYPDYVGWGMTTGIFDETIANLGLAGLLAGPLLVRWLCRIGDASRRWNVHILTCIVACLLMSVQLTAFAPLLLLWLFFVKKPPSIRPKPLAMPMQPISASK